MPDPPTPEYLVKAFRHFAAICAESDSPLYAELSAKIAEDERVIVLASHNAARQPPPNMLLGAVHFLLLGGADHELRAFYPSLGGTRSPDQVWPVFREFALAHEETIIELVRQRRVQTNEVGRCAVLLPALGVVRGRFQRPIGLIEVGASAGLNLLFDRYRYAYSDGRRVDPEGDPDGAVIRCELRGNHVSGVPILASMPSIASRIGVDLAPVDVTDPDAMRWVQSLIWPDQTDRINLFQSAVQIAQREPPLIVEADALDVIDGLLHRTPPDALPTVYHTHAVYQMSRDWRSAFDEKIHHAARDAQRDAAHLSIEWLDNEDGPQVRLTEHMATGEINRTHLAACHHHGRWLEWLADKSERPDG